MNDLISRKAVLDKLKDFSDMYTLKEEAKVVLEAIKEMITEQPTAYDVEKVVAELEEMPNREADHYYANSNDVIDREDAIDIVKRGGVE